MSFENINSKYCINQQTSISQTNYYTENEDANFDIFNEEYQTTEIDNIFAAETSEISEIEATQMLNTIENTDYTQQITTPAISIDVNSLTKEQEQIILQELENQVNTLKESFEETVENRGWLSGLWDGFKNLTKIGAGSDKTKAKINNAELFLEKAKNGKIKLQDAYKEITGKELNNDELTKFVTGETSITQDSTLADSVNKYQEGQKMCVDIVGDIASGIAAVGAVAFGTMLGFCAAPFTAGASLGLVAGGFAIAAGTGAAVKCAVKATDCIGNDRTYTGKDLGYDLITGSINGLMGPLSNGCGGAASTAVAKSMGMEALETTAKKVITTAGKEIIEETAEAAIKNGGKNLLKKGIVLATEYAVDGGLSGATDGFARALAEGRIEDIPQDMLTGAIGGVIASPIIGAGMKGAGKLGAELGQTAIGKVTKNIAKETGDAIANQSKKALKKILPKNIIKIGNNLKTSITNKISSNLTKQAIQKAVVKNADEGFDVTIGDYIVRIAKDELTEEMLTDNAKIYDLAYNSLTKALNDEIADEVSDEVTKVITDEVDDTVTQQKIPKTTTDDITPTLADETEDAITPTKAVGDNTDDIITPPKTPISSTTEISDITPETKTQQLKDLGVISDYETNKITQKSNKQYQRAIDLIKNKYMGIDGALYLSDILDLDEAAYARVDELINANCRYDSIAKLAQLPEEQYARAVQLLKEGYDTYAIRCIDWDTNPNGILNESSKIKAPTSSGIDYSKMTPELKQSLVDKINSTYGKNVVSVNDNIGTIAEKWRAKYVDGGITPLSLDNETINFFIENSCTRFVSENQAPLARWMEVPNLSYYIDNLPAEGELYTFDRMQSFAKTTYGAEKIHGNNFSDSNIYKNVKIIVEPNSKLTNAYDIGQGKYGSDEALYKAGAEFTVVSKGFEEITLPDGTKNKMYVVHLKEVATEAMQPSTTTLKPDIQLFASKGTAPIYDFELDEELNEIFIRNSAEMEKTYLANISTVEKQIQDVFSDLPTVAEDGITARAKSQKSIFQKLTSKFKNNKLLFIDIDSCIPEVADAYGTRIQIKSLSAETANEIIEKHIKNTGITRDEIIDYLKGDLSAYSDYQANQISIPGEMILQELKTQQTDEVVNRLIKGIEDGSITITELNNYGNEVSSYFTDKQIQSIADTYYTKTGKPLKIVSLFNFENGGSKTIIDEEALRNGTIEAIQGEYHATIDKTKAIKNSGYSTSQMNTKHILDDGTEGLGELQIRGQELNRFADAEHVPYDIRQGKITELDTKYSEIYSTIKTMSNDSYKKYNEYLTDIYNWYRLKELGITIDEPKMLTDLTNKKGIPLNSEQLQLISHTNLLKYAH